jgi:hypothetical protein
MLEASQPLRLSVNVSPAAKMVTFGSGSMARLAQWPPASAELRT